MRIDHELQLSFTIELLDALEHNYKRSIGSKGMSCTPGELDLLPQEYLFDLFNAGFLNPAKAVEGLMELAENEKYPVPVRRIARQWAKLATDRSSQ